MTPAPRVTLNDLAARFAGRRVAVVGDVMLDHFIVGKVERISPEAPVPVVRFAHDEFRLGGAANVANNITTLGGRAVIIGTVGNDDAAAQLKADATAAGFDISGLVTDPSRPTTRKTRVVTVRNQQVARVDYEADTDVEGSTAAALVDRITAAAAAVDAIVLSDYRKGVITPAVIEAAVTAARASGVPLLVDPKVAQADRYRGAALITPNHHEAELMTQIRIRTVDDARAAAAALRERTGASVLITWGEHGMFVADRAAAPGSETLLPAVAREVADVTGAGDTVIAVLALSLAAGGSLIDAARLANLAAGIVVGRFGPAAVTASELSAAVSSAQP